MSKYIYIIVIVLLGLSIFLMYKIEQTFSIETSVYDEFSVEDLPEIEEIIVDFDQIKIQYGNVQLAKEFNSFLKNESGSDLKLIESNFEGYSIGDVITTSFNNIDESILVQNGLIVNKETLVNGNFQYTIIDYNELYMKTTMTVPEFYEYISTDSVYSIESNLGEVIELELSEIINIDGENIELRFVISENVEFPLFLNYGYDVRIIYGEISDVFFIDYVFEEDPEELIIKRDESKYVYTYFSSYVSLDKTIIYYQDISIEDTILYRSDLDD